MTKKDESAESALTAEQDAGFVGVEVDPTPNENYTVQGVVAGKPTPETDPEQAKKVRDHAAGL